MNIKIIFEDDSFLVIDKPSGVVVNRAETTKEETIQDWVEKYVIASDSEAISSVPEEIATSPTAPRNDNILEEFQSRGGIVHRLDKDTSGVLVIAKTPAAFENLKNQFKNRETVKKYLALVHGEVELAVGTVNAPIERNPFNRMRFGIFPGGREAETGYKVYKEYNGYTLLEITPKTGRTHQIRVHMKHLNHPVVSDPIYGGRKQSKQDLSLCPRLFLHATSLSLKHPLTSEVLTFTSPLPVDLDKVLSAIGGSALG